VGSQIKKILGYHGESTNCKLFDPFTNKITMARDVVIIEISDKLDRISNNILSDLIIIDENSSK